MSMQSFRTSPTMDPASAARPLTEGPAHHFFGFHDLKVTDNTGASFIALEVDHINRPPLGGLEARVVIGTVAPEPRPLRTIGTTTCFNFPQGARQQWLGRSSSVIFNALSADGDASSLIVDAATGDEVARIGSSVYCTDRTGERGFTIDFGRLHRLGGYGHPVVKECSPRAAVPDDNGVFSVDLLTGERTLVIGIGELARLAGFKAQPGIHHFITHLRLNPAEDRLAFLYRFRLPDGGEDTSLWTVGLDGSNPRLLTRGFNSHYDWIEDNRLLIWGRPASRLAAARTGTLASLGILKPLVRLLKAPARAILGKTTGNVMSFLTISDDEESSPARFAVGTLTTDGHPMLNPVWSDWIALDTYPLETGDRELMLLHVPTAKRVELGRYPLLTEEADSGVVAEVEEAIREQLSVNFDAEQYAFTRSGLHCDLHPRWDAPGANVVFDSIHEGTRQIYCVEVEGLLREEINTRDA